MKTTETEMTMMQPKDIAKALQISVKSARLALRGKLLLPTGEPMPPIPSITIGKRRRVSSAALARWIAESTAV